MVQDPKDYRWSSYPFFKGKADIDQPYFNPDIVLNGFTGTLVERTRKYCEYITSPS
jgi:hypothetical protein